jgi:von Willebrand factor type A domain-containing protein
MQRTMRAATVLVSMLAGIRGLEAQGNRQVLVAVVDGTTGALITDLQPDEFEVRENNLSRKVVRARLANDPMRIALTVDSSRAVEPMTNEFRAGLQRFFAALPSSTEVSLMTTGGQARLRFSTTSDRKKLSDAASGFFTDGGGNAALDGVMQGYDQFLKKAEARWPVLVLVTADGPVGGTVRDDQFQRFVRELQARAVVAHAIVVSTRGGGTPTSIALSLAKSTGGLYEAIAAATALPDKMKALGEKLADESRPLSRLYRLEYLTETNGPSPLQVSVLRSGARVTIVDHRQLK